MNHTLGSSGGATAVHDEERVRERHLVVITVTFERDGDVASDDNDDVDGDDDDDVEAYLFKSELGKISVWISTKLEKIFEEGRVTDAAQIDL